MTDADMEKIAGKKSPIEFIAQNGLVYIRYAHLGSDPASGYPYWETRWCSMTPLEADDLLEQLPILLQQAREQRAADKQHRENELQAALQALRAEQ